MKQSQLFFVVLVLFSLFIPIKLFAMTVDAGTNVTLNYSTAEVGSCGNISGPSYSFTLASINTTSSTGINNVTAGKSGTYTLACTGKDGSQKSASDTLTVNPAPVTTCTDSEWQYQDTVNVASWCSANAGVTCTGNKHWGPTMTCHGNINTHTYSAFTRGTSCTLIDPYCDCPTSGPDSVCVDNVCGTYPSPANATPNNTKTPPANNLEPWTYNNTTPGSCTYTCDSNSERIGNACVPKITSCPNGATDAACTPAPGVTADINPKTAVAYGGGFTSLSYTVDGSSPHAPATSCTGQLNSDAPWDTAFSNGKHNISPSGSYTSDTTWTFDCTNAGGLHGTASVTLLVNAPLTFSLNVTKDGTGTGVVTSSPGGINCGTTCSNKYNEGTVVTLTANANSGSTFKNWGGDCSGSGSCIVTMDAIKSVTATFDTSACPNGATDAACTPAPGVTAVINPTTAVAYGGGFNSLIYTTKNATSCTGQQTGGVVSGPWVTDAWDGSHPLVSGSYTSNVTWTFDCTNAGGLHGTAQVTLLVTPYVAPVTPIVTSSFTPSVIPSDGSTLYTFRATDADHCIVTHPDGTGTWDTTTTYFPPTTYFASLYPTGLTTTVSCNYQGGTYVASTATLTVCAAGQNVVANTCVTPSAYNCGVGTGIPTGDNIKSNSTATGPNQNWAYDGVGTAACTWTCKTGFKKSGNTCVIETITCPALNTGSYTSSSGTCTYSFNKAAGAIVGDTTNSIALTSPAGYTGSLSEKCQSNGTWANNIGTCTSPTSGVTPPGGACNPLTQDVQVDCDNITGNTVTGQLIRRQTAKADCTFPSVSTSDPIIKNTCAWTCNNGSPFPTSCPSPVITSISLSGNNTPDGTINFTCTDTQSYTLTRDGIAVTSGAYTGPTSIPLATFGSIMGYYTIKCLSGGAVPGSKDLPLYDPKPLTTDAVTLDATPLTLKSGTPTALNWSINIPDPGCTIIALPVCPGGSCNPSMDQNRITYANNLSSQLLNSQTDINDPYGYRPMTTALRTKVVGLKAIGKKSFNLQYTTEFLLDCHINVEGRISPKKYLRVQVTNDNEG